MRAASSGDSSNELLSEVRWLQWKVWDSELFLPPNNLYLLKSSVPHLPESSVPHLPKSSVLDLSWSGIKWRLQRICICLISQCCVLGDDTPLPTTSLLLPNLSVLELHSVDVTEDWEGWRGSFMTAKRLRVLDLGLCCRLRCTPDLSAFTQLKVLTLSWCTRLEHLHPSIGKLKSLVSLDLSDCKSLKELPEEVGELTDLEELVLDRTDIIEIPTSIGYLRKLKKLSAHYCESLREIPSSIGDLQNLQYLNLSGPEIEKLPSAIGDLSSVKHLDLLAGNKLRSLPQLSSLIHLEGLHLHACHLLEDILELPSRLLKLTVRECGKLILLKLDGLKNLEVLSIEKCNSIERLDLSQSICLKRLHVEDCEKLAEIQGHDNLEFLEDIYIYCCNSIERLLCPKSRCLKQLVAIGCNKLVEIRGLDSVKFLEKLKFGGCESMETLPNLMGCEKLRSLHVQDCKKLTQLRGLENLDLIYFNIFCGNSFEGIPKYEIKLVCDPRSDVSSTQDSDSELS